MTFSNSHLSLVLIFTQQHTVVVQFLPTFLFKAFHQLRNRHLAAFLAADIQNHSAAAHHDGAISHLERGGDVVRNHHGGDFVVSHNLLGDFQHLFRCSGV